jgi:hypothetical protein
VWKVTALIIIILLLMAEEEFFKGGKLVKEVMKKMKVKQ